MVIFLYRLIVTDMDGTLLNSLSEIPKKNLQAIQKAMDAGVEFAIVTGRPYSSVKGFLQKTGLKCSVIGCNGAQVTDQDGKLVRAHYIDRESLNDIMRMANKRDLYYQIYDNQYIYTRSRTQMLKMLKNYSAKSIKRHINFRNILGGIKRLFFADVKVEGDLISFASNRDEGFYKIQISSLSQEELNGMREDLKSVPHIDITSSSYFNIEIGPEGVTKGTALAELAQVKNIPREETIAMGDNYNDLPMIEYAGCGVAMENAVSPVKDKANFITKSNDDFGVAYAIEKLIFKK